MHPRVFVIFRGEISGPLWGIAPLLWARHIAHFYCTVGLPSVGAGDPALPYKKLHSVWAVQLHQNYRFVSRSLFRT